MKKVAWAIAALSVFVVPSTWMLWQRSMKHGEAIAQTQVRDEYQEKKLDKLEEIQRQQVLIFQRLAQHTPTPGR